METDPNADTGMVGGVHWVRDRQTGDKLAVENDADFDQALHDFNASACSHPEVQWMRVPVEGGGVQVRQCCVICGHREGRAASQKDREWVQSLPVQPQDHSQTYDSRRSMERYIMLLTHARRQAETRGRFTREYREYLASPEWAAKRAKVLKRCGGVCEGCGEAKAVHVHHQSYEHLGNEFLFELLGVCRKCHDRLHPNDEPEPVGEPEEISWS